MLGVTWCLFSAYRKVGKLSNEEQTTGLQIVAGALLKEFPYKQVFRIGGDEFVVISEDADENECALRMERIAQQVASHDYYIAYGIAHSEDGIGADRIAQEADVRMLENKRAYYAEREQRRSLTDTLPSE